MSLFLGFWNSIAFMLLCVVIILMLVLIAEESKKSRTTASWIAIALLVIGLGISISSVRDSHKKTVLRAQYPYQSDEWKSDYSKIMLDGFISSEEYSFMQSKVKSKIIGAGK